MMFNNMRTLQKTALVCSCVLAAQPALSSSVRLPGCNDVAPVLKIDVTPAMLGRVLASPLALSRPMAPKKYLLEQKLALAPLKNKFFLRISGNIFVFNNFT